MILETSCRLKTTGILVFFFYLFFTLKHEITMPIKLFLFYTIFKTFSATISQILDIDTGSTDWNISLNGSVQILGKKLLIGGDDSGIWFAPATGEDGVIDESGTDWTQVTAKISVNKPGTLLFPLPKTLTAGTYRIVLKTRCTSNLKYKRKELITTVSDVIQIQ